MADGLLEPLSALSLKPAARLLIRNSTSSSTNSLSFENCKTLGSFAIDGEKNYVRGQEPPAIRWPEKLTNLDIDLNRGIDDAVFITDYTEYAKLKREFFFRWLLDEYLTSDGGPFSHEFIGFCDRFTEILETPFIRRNEGSRCAKWSTIAVKFNGSIFLLDKNPKPSTSERHSKVTYYGQRFQHILTSPDPESVVVNQYSKAFIIRSSDFGKHKIMCLREVDAMDENMDYVELKMHEDPWYQQLMKERRLHYWAQCVPAGVEVLALGKRGRNGFLETIDLVEAKDLTDMTGGNWNPSVCYEFADRLLTWMASHLVDDNPTVVKKFQWRVEKDEVEVLDVDVSSPVIPQWFVDGVAAKRKESAALL